MASEKEAALAATPSDAPPIFDKIIKKEIPSIVVYEDDKARIVIESDSYAVVQLLRKLQQEEDADSQLLLKISEAMKKISSLSFSHVYRECNCCTDLLADYSFTEEDVHVIFDCPPQALAFRDFNPQAPVHILIIPKVKDGLTGLSKAEERHYEILGRLLYTAKLIAKQEGLL